MGRVDVRFVKSVLLSLLALLLATGADAWAQYGRHGRPQRGLAGVYVLAARPLDEFEDYVDTSPGLGGYFLINADRHSPVGLRLDGSLIIYGSETIRRPFSGTIPFVFVDVTTDNVIGSLFLGPQLTAGRGRLRLYSHAGMGFSYFGTSSSIEEEDHFHHHGTIASSTHFDDWALAWTGGGGLALGLSRSVFIDLSAQYVNNGRVRYLREGSIIERPDGSIWFVPIESTANVLMMKVGVSFAFR